MLAFKSQGGSVLIIGSNTVAATRAFAAREADYNVLLLAPGDLQNACPEIRHRVETAQAEMLSWDDIFPGSEDVVSTGIRSILHDRPQISLVCVADTSLREGENRRAFASAQQIYKACRDHRVPVNVADIPELCSFTFPASHRFSNPESGNMTALQIAVTTNGRGCRLGGRFKREIVSRLPRLAGVAVEKIGQLRELSQNTGSPTPEDKGIDSAYHGFADSPSPNQPVVSISRAASHIDKAQRRMRWVAQISEFWQIERLAALKHRDMEALLQENQAILNTERQSNGIEKKTSDCQPDIRTSDTRTEHSHHGLILTAPSPRTRGKIYLLGSGIGHPSLLTVAACEILTKKANLVLSDKLVPSSILDLIPDGVQVVIARKFPGNADQAQSELMEMAVEAAERGEIVARLKQGDPMVYGRAGEEILYFREKGFEPVVIPGLSSAIAGPALAGISVTQRGVAETFIICTGVGRQGKEVQMPGYRRERTTVVLMGVARLSQLIQCLTAPETPGRDGSPYPGNLPIAIIERSSMPDQRVVLSTLGEIESAFAGLGSQRPPGMIVIGWAVLALAEKGFTDILDGDTEHDDMQRLKAWLGNSSFKVLEGLTEDLIAL